MTSAEKALARLKARPTDLTWRELVSIMDRLHFRDVTQGGGSHRKFVNEVSGHKINLPRPHPDPVKRYAVDLLVDFLEERGYL